ncbi:hypothetical protein TIFTF001_050961 [Ficus carica]|uniref:Vacuolar iron transporter n=1 Tax=Ficus carica TaxID=3494 RepID=A0AA88CJD1_FICCA|nr:hypothetical protein TIFTF001_050955 [Ficus carica]GMN19742.1 hypothetical protein TIFTF001_050957 [Ficus carica]GMN19755.1 hypothetical protein TIFTF001_050959 [Ficus carica]GMN19771.1 hypothetical protein TIFTF001_050961 [Ficus carica]
MLSAVIRSALGYPAFTAGMIIGTPEVIRIFTDMSISLSLSPRQCPGRYTFRAGRNLSDKEFRYHWTVIVMATVHWGFGHRLPCHQVTNFLDLPALGRLATEAVLASVVLTLVALILFGFAKGYFTGNQPFKSAIETAFIRAIASATAYSIAKVFRA